VPVREVLRFPHPTLKRVADAAGPGDLRRAATLAGDLVETMRGFPGCVGIAANQVGELLRVIVVDVSEHPKAETSNGLLTLVNPQVTSSSGSEVAREGCLSIPDYTANVRRATSIELIAQDPDGGGRQIEAHGFEARCLLHEIDHLDGLLFLDRVDSLKTDVFRRKRRESPEPGSRPEPPEASA
jgi:peptide deformylase